MARLRCGCVNNANSIGVIIGRTKIQRKTVAAEDILSGICGVCIRIGNRNVRFMLITPAYIPKGV